MFKIRFSILIEGARVGAGQVQGAETAALQLQVWRYFGACCAWKRDHFQILLL